VILDIAPLIFKLALNLLINQLRVPNVLHPRMETPIHMKWEAMWVSEQVRTIWRL